MSYAPVSSTDNTNNSSNNPSSSSATSPSTASLPTTFSASDIDGQLDSSNKPKSTTKPVDNSLSGNIQADPALPTVGAAVVQLEQSIARSFWQSITSTFMSNNSNINSSIGSGSVNGGSSTGLEGVVDSLGLRQQADGVMSKLSHRNWLKTFRPIPQFVGQQMFSKPRTTAEAIARIEANLPHFLTNYMILCAIVTVLTILSKPSLIFLGVLLWLMWGWVTAKDEIRLGSLVLTGRTKMIALTSITGLVLFLFAGTTIFFLVGMCASIVIGHAVMHNLPALEDFGEDERQEMQAMNSSV